MRRPGMTLLCIVLSACSGGGGGNGADNSYETVASDGNRPPIILNPIPDQYHIVGRPFHFDLNHDGNTFSDADGDPLVFTVTGLPPGLDAIDSEVSGVPSEVGPFLVRVSADDGRGRSVSGWFRIIVQENLPPTVARANADQFLTIGSSIDMDATANDTVFFDGNDDELQYEVELASPSRGLVVDGVRVSGTFDSIGLVRVTVTAIDPNGATAQDEFVIVAPDPEPGRPSLPTTTYVYADEELPLPPKFESSSRSGAPFWDTTPRYNRITNEIATLGRVLFYDKRLSITNTLACASCHEQARGFSSSERFSTGVQGRPTTRHAMPLTNVRYNGRDRYFSDMRARTLESLVLMPIEAPLELGQSLELLEIELAETDFYPALFKRAFGSTIIDRDGISLALAQFLRSLISYQSRYDLEFHDWSNGSPGSSDVFTEQERRGAGLFTHCDGCHTDGVHAMYGSANNGLDAVIEDPGVLGTRPGTFRSASLRNVEVSAPYMHDGRFSTLREVIDHYDSGVQMNPGLSDSLKTRLPDGTEAPKRLNLTEQDKADLEAFLRTLTDEAFLSDPRFSDPFQ